MRLTQLSRLTSNLARPSGPTLASIPRLYVRKADNSGFEPFQVRKPDNTGWEDFQVRTNG